MGENIVLHCIKDYSDLTKIGEKKVYLSTDKNKKLVFPMFECPVCKKHYTSIGVYRDGFVFKFANQDYINILSVNDSHRFSNYLKKTPGFPKAGSKCYVYGVKKSQRCRNCNRVLDECWCYTITKKGKKHKYRIKQCLHCGCKHMSFGQYNQYRDIWVPINDEELFEIEKEYLLNQQIKAARKEERKKLKEQKQQEIRELYIKQNSVQKDSQSSEGGFAKPIDAKKPSINKVVPRTEPVVRKEASNIGFKDFVVRRTTFKCRHNNHQLKDISVGVDIIDKYGDIKSVKVVAGYCPNCNVYFIMESVYQNLKKKGTLACRLSDEKAYLNGNTYVNGMMLAQESILKQYGYNVSQEEGLTEARRRKILALLVDNKVMTRNDIISYLDFFINQRKYQHKFEKAIDKWTRDKEFIANYKSGEYSQYGVTRIYRKY